MFMRNFILIAAFETTILALSLRTILAHLREPTWAPLIDGHIYIFIKKHPMYFFYKFSIVMLLETSNILVFKKIKFEKDAS